MVKRNKMILATAILLLVIGSTVFILLNSEICGPPSFHRIQNQNTGEDLSIVMSVFLYLIFWAFFAMIPTSAVFLFSMCVYSILHRKDKRLLEKRYHPPYEDELHFCGYVSFASTYTAFLLLLILQVSNLMDIHVI